MGAGGEDIDHLLDSAYEAELAEKQQQEDFSKLETQRESYAGILREKKTDIQEGMVLSAETTQLIEDSLDLTNQVIKEEGVDLSTEHISTLTTVNEEIYASFAIIDAAIQQETNEFDYKSQERVYTAEDLPKLRDSISLEQAKFRKVFFENII